MVQRALLVGRNGSGMLLVMVVAVVVEVEVEENDRKVFGNYSDDDVVVVFGNRCC